VPTVSTTNAFTASINGGASGERMEIRDWRLEMNNRGSSVLDKRFIGRQINAAKRGFLFVCPRLYALASLQFFRIEQNSIPNLHSPISTLL
jgi:hypothetical protein